MIIKNLINSIRDYKRHIKILNRIYEEENLIHNLSGILGVNVKKDWIGRLYAVINPNIQDMKLDISTQIFEYDENGLTNKSYVEKWLMDRMVLAESFINTQELFDVLTYEIRKIDDYDNYLLILTPITWIGLKEDAKKFIYLLLSIFGVGIGGLILFLTLK